MGSWKSPGFFVSKRVGTLIEMYGNGPVMKSEGKWNRWFWGCGICPLWSQTVITHRHSVMCENPSECECYWLADSVVYWYAAYEKLLICPEITFNQPVFPGEYCSLGSVPIGCPKKTFMDCWCQSTPGMSRPEFSWRIKSIKVVIIQ